MDLLRRLLSRPCPPTGTRADPHPSGGQRVRGILLTVLARILAVGHSTNASGNNRSTR